MRSLRRPAAVAATLALAACTTGVAPRIAAPPPLPVVAPPPPVLDWRDLPRSDGRWRYGAGVAAFLRANGTIALELRCDAAARTVTITRTGAVGPLALRTSYGARDVAGPLPVGDRLLDEIAFSRGHFTVAAAGLPLLVLPAWAEPGRLIEDCRG